MRKRLHLLAFLVPFASILSVPAYADAPAVTAVTRKYMDVTDLPELVAAMGTPGDYHLKVADDGSVSIVPFLLITPGVTDPPDPPISTSLSKKSELEADKIGDPETAARLSVAYSVVLVLADDGVYGEDGDSLISMETAVTQATDAILNTNELQQRWQPWRDAMSDALDVLTREGDLDNLGEYESAVEQIRDGLVASSQKAGFAGFDIGSIFGIIEVVMDALGGDFNLFEIIKAILEIFGGFGMVEVPR